MDYIYGRIKEPSTFAGIAAAIFGIGQLFKLDGSEQIAQAVVMTGQKVIEGGATTESLVMAGAGFLASIFAIFGSDK